MPRRYFSFVGSFSSIPSETSVIASRCAVLFATPSRLESELTPISVSSSEKALRRRMAVATEERRVFPLPSAFGLLIRAVIGCSGARDSCGRCGFGTPSQFGLHAPRCQMIEPLPLTSSMDSVDIIRRAARPHSHSSTVQNLTEGEELARPLHAGRHRSRARMPAGAVSRTAAGRLPVQSRIKSPERWGDQADLCRLTCRSSVHQKDWYSWLGSNQRPTDPQSDALPTELQLHGLWRAETRGKGGGFKPVERRPGDPRQDGPE